MRFFSIAPIIFFAFTGVANASDCPKHFTQLESLSELISDEFVAARRAGIPRAGEAYRMQDLMIELSDSLAVEGFPVAFIFANRDDVERARRVLGSMREIVDGSVGFFRMKSLIAAIPSEIAAANIFDAAVDFAKWDCLSKSSLFRATSEGYNRKLIAVPLDDVGALNYNQVVAASLETAIDESGLWGDTILEGDYVQTGEATAEQIMALKQEGIIVGYRMNIVADAIMTASDSCEFDAMRDQWIGDCLSGQIFSERMIDWKLREIRTPHEPDFRD
jgi:hypothetical protein